jgi:hypothetical protein
MSGFTFPTGFLTAVLQTSARQNNVSHSQKQIFKRNEIVFESINTKYIITVLL